MLRDREARILDGALPVMRNYIVETWWATKSPVQASKGRAEVRKRAGLDPNSNPDGWWGRAWTAMEASRQGVPNQDAWMLRFEPYFRGLERVPDRKPDLYVVVDPTECPPARVEFERAVTMWSDGQGHLQTAEERRAIEEAGMREGRSWLRSKGFSEEQIEDKSKTESYDLRAEREGKTMYVEAKGCSSPWSEESTLIVPRNEVLHARRHPSACALVIAAACELSRDGEGKLVATPHERIVIFPWRPDDKDLSAVAYRYPISHETIAQLQASRTGLTTHSRRAAQPSRRSRP